MRFLHNVLAMCVQAGLFVFGGLLVMGETAFGNSLMVKLIGIYMLWFVISSVISASITSIYVDILRAKRKDEEERMSKDDGTRS